MGSITALLKKHRIIALDTCLWIYHFEKHPELSKPVGQILTAVAKGQCQAIASELVLLELITGPLKVGRQDAADEYEILLTHYPNLTLAPITRNILLEAAQIRALYGFRSPDAIILATAKEHGATLVVSNDLNWSRYPDFTILRLSDFA
jgi:predicted nucleic acid-binding protein